MSLSVFCEYLVQILTYLFDFFPKRQPIEFSTKPSEDSSFNEWLWNYIQPTLQCFKIVHFLSTAFCISDFTLLFPYLENGLNRLVCSSWKALSIEQRLYFSITSIYLKKASSWFVTTFVLRSFRTIIRNYGFVTLNGQWWCIQI